MTSPRYLGPALDQLAFPMGKMSFISGPRQCGKTTFAKGLLEARGRGAYANWDETDFRRAWTRSPRSWIEASIANATPTLRPLLVFDEIHKAKGWKRTIKGAYDTLDGRADILVTGSARLNVYQRGSDSLMGRYLHFRMHPFTLGELLGKPPLGPDAFLLALDDSPPPKAAVDHVQALWTFGGFPEPLFRASTRVLRLWQQGRIEKLVREDARDLSRIPELSQVEMLVSLLPERAGSRLSVQALREILEVAHITVRRHLDLLAELYYCFELRPFTGKVARSLHKEPKLYLWDWSEVKSEGARFENMVACHLLKAVHFWTDTGEGQFELRYARDKQKREIDFVVLRDKAPWLAVECKLADEQPDPSLHYLGRQLGDTPRVQCVKTSRVFRRMPDGTLVVGFDRLAARLP